MAEENLSELRPIVTREEAKAAGLKRYFEGDECAYGHVAERLVRNQGCTECARIRSQAWRDANPEKSKESWSKHRAQNRDKIIKRNRERNEFPCRYCGKHIDFPEARPGAKRTSRPKYCSDYCRLYSKVSQEPGQGPKSDCWEFQGGKHRFGYGMINMSESKASDVTVSHIVAWEISNGPVPDGLFVCHKCDNPPCCKPDHLFLGTHQDNMDDMVKKGRSGSRLPEWEILEIRASSESDDTLAKKYGCSPLTIWRIRSGKTWTNLQQD